MDYLCPPKRERLKDFHYRNLGGGAYKGMSNPSLFSAVSSFPSFPPSPQKQQQEALPGAKAVLLLRAHRHLLQINTHCDVLELVRGSHVPEFVVPWLRMIDKPVPEACHTPMVQNNGKCILTCCLNWDGL